jgi:hypothetical protein
LGANENKGKLKVKAEKDGKKPTWPPQASRTKEQKSEALPITKKKVAGKQKQNKKGIC